MGRLQLRILDNRLEFTDSSPLSLMPVASAGGLGMQFLFNVVSNGIKADAHSAPNSWKLRSSIASVDYV